MFVPIFARVVAEGAVKQVAPRLVGATIAAPIGIAVSVGTLAYTAYKLLKNDDKKKDSRQNSNRRR